ncbi:MAG TPA: sigma-70 family RNA polymerase sigma factor [Actinomycetes bacterium]|nr:sigma-70 family RNA polymerase sigma factor [Actinomycetes bacterium]
MFSIRPAQGSQGAKGAQDASQQAVAGVELTAADLVAARRRNPDAVARIYRAYAPGLYRFFVAALGDKHAAEDLTGNVFADAIKDLPGFNGPVEALGGWLFRIARHDLYDHRRREARARTENLDDVRDEAAMAAGAPDPEELAVQRLEGSRVMAALNELSHDQREVLLLRIAAGLTAPEVAATLGKTTGAVKALQHRGLASLARLLDLGSDRRSDEVSEDPYPSEPPGRLPRREEG